MGFRGGIHPQSLVHAVGLGTADTQNSHSPGVGAQYRLSSPGSPPASRQLCPCRERPSRDHTVSSGGRDVVF